MPISWTRQSYEAAVLLIPLDPQARAAIGKCEQEVLAEVTIADADLLKDHEGFGAEVPRIPRISEEAAVSSPLERAVHDADIVILLAYDLAAADDATIVHVGDAAHSTGTLLGAVVISPDLRWHDAAAHRTAYTLRESADSVAVLSDLGLALAFLQVLRGGTRDEPLALTEAPS